MTSTPRTPDDAAQPRDDEARAVPLTPTSIDRTSGEVEQHPHASTPLPGARRDGYTSLPTGPVEVEPVTETGPDADGEESRWEPALATERVDDMRLAPWALLAAIVALCASFFVGWGIPVAVVAVIAAIMSLRRPVESRAIARWALVLGLCATIYSLGWLVWAGMQFERIG